MFYDGFIIISIRKSIMRTRRRTVKETRPIWKN